MGFFDAFMWRQQPPPPPPSHCGSVCAADVKNCLMAALFFAARCPQNSGGLVGLGFTGVAQVQRERAANS